MTSKLLPGNATSWERAVADAAVPPEVVESAIRAIRGAKLSHPVPDMLPFIVWELGLGELSPYVQNLYDLISEGIAWQRVRGTPLAVAMGLGWLGYAGAIEEAKTYRRYWNSFQLRFTSLPANDDPLLDQIGGVVGLSVPQRSRLHRGVFEHDVPALELGASRLGWAMLGNESGYRLVEDGPVWSFGRTHEFEHVLTEAEGEAAGNWVSPIFYEVPAILLDFVADTYAVAGEPLTRAEFEAAYFTRDGVADLLAISEDGAAFDADIDESIVMPLSDADVPANEGAFIWRGEVTATNPGQWSRVFEVGSDSPENLISIFVGSDGNLSVNVTRGETYLGGATTGSSPIGGGVQTVGIAWSGSTIRIRINDGPTITGAAALAFPEDDERPSFGETVADTTVKQISVFKRYLTSAEFNEAMDNLVAGETTGPEIEDASGVRWIDLDITWEDADFPWSSSPLEARAAAMASWYVDRGSYFALKDSGGDVIGYRRTRSAHVVAQSTGGRFGIEATKFEPAGAGGLVYFEAMTDFGMEAAEVAGVSLIVGGSPVAGIKPGKLWLEPNELTGGVEIATQAFDFTLRKTVRERIKLLLRF